LYVISLWVAELECGEDRENEMEEERGAQALCPDRNLVTTIVY